MTRTTVTDPELTADEARLIIEAVHYRNTAAALNIPWKPTAAERRLVAWADSYPSPSREAERQKLADRLGGPRPPTPTPARMPVPVPKPRDIGTIAMAVILGGALAVSLFDQFLEWLI